MVKQFVTYDVLRNFSGRKDARSLTESATVQYGKTVFLSHSSDDHDMVPGVVLILERHGGSVYIDERDAEITGDNIHHTAKRLRDAVKTCRKFVLFVTEQTKDSKWIPWELGLGDGNKNHDNVALFPSAEKVGEESWAEQEYLSLYQRIIWGNISGRKEEFLVLDHRKNTAIPLGDWLKY